MIASRRTFLTGLGAAMIAAPAIVRAGSLMPVKQMLATDIIEVVLRDDVSRYEWSVIGNIIVTGIDIHGNGVTEIIEIADTWRGPAAQSATKFKYISGIAAGNFK